MSITAPEPQAISVLAIGASSAIGYGVGPMQAAMAGGLRNFQDGSLLAADGEPARLSSMADFPDNAPRAARISALTQRAVADMLENITFDVPSRMPVHVGLGSDSPDGDLDEIAEAVADGSRRRLLPSDATTQGHCSGRIALLSAVSSAVQSLERGAPMALVVATDTLCTLESVSALIRNRRLLTSEDDGSIPGEASVALLVTSVGTALAARRTRFCLSPPAFGIDDCEAMRTAPQQAGGLARTFRALRQHLGTDAARPSRVIGYDSGELFFTRIFNTAYLRNVEMMPEPLQHELVVTNVGDTGAAAAGVALVRADWLLRQPDDGAERLLIYGHADDGRCAAVMASRPDCKVRA